MQNQLVICPKCGQPSDSIKQYKLPYKWIFVWIMLFHQDIEYTCCPHCMRKQILLRGFTYNIILANLLWLIIILPWCLVLLICSFTKGHSKAVKEYIEQNH